MGDSFKRNRHTLLSGLGIPLVACAVFICFLSVLSVLIRLIARF